MRCWLVGSKGRMTTRLFVGLKHDAGAPDVHPGTALCRARRRGLSLSGLERVRGRSTIRLHPCDFAS